MDIVEANINRYRDGKVVEGYLTDKRHARRMELALQMLHRQLASTFPEKRERELQILELGAGEGTASRHLLEYGYSVTATDACTDPLEHLRNLEADVLELEVSQPFPLETGVFHGLFMGELIEHIFDLRQLLSECHRVLRPGGILLITTPNMARLIDRIRFLRGKAPRHVDPNHEYIHLHIRPFTFSLLKTTLNRSGFHLEERASNFVKLGEIHHQPIQSRSLARCCPGWGDSLIVAARKA